MIDAERLATNLLSSMPLAFNLLAPWMQAFERTSGYLRELLPAFTGTARQLLFEHSHRCGNPKYALIRYSDVQSRNGFVAFELKYFLALERLDGLNSNEGGRRPSGERTSRDGRFFGAARAPRLCCLQVRCQGQRSQEVELASWISQYFKARLARAAHGELPSSAR